MNGGSVGAGTSSTSTMGLFEQPEEDVASLPEWHLPSAFSEPRHSEEIRGLELPVQNWRIDRMKTVSVALVLALNVGVDPPDIIKTQPCAKLEAWIDPLSMATQKALEAIGNNLQKQYERWQSRARYKQSLDPTVEEVKKLCTSLRRNAKDERVLFHYNGHGVPRPTVNGEIWVFNRHYTQYIPLSLYDLQQWMGAPSLYVYDCSGSGQIVESFNQFALQHEREWEMSVKNQGQEGSGLPIAGQEASAYPRPNYTSCIQLAACAADQILPMNPDLPADLFTACLTTPIKIALQWFIMHNSSKLLPGITLEILDRIPGQLTDRRTMLGELNWIFTAITDTIAWDVLPRRLFQQLFRQDQLVASLFRNFLLADRIMRSYNCTPVSHPRLPSTCHHPMWQAWDLTVDICLTQLPSLLNEESPAVYRHSSFFSEQLTAFQVWLSAAPHHTRSQPEQLPIVLQVLLSQVHRLRALDLLNSFLAEGPWAVNLALSVHIFPYVLRLLQSSARELRPLLVFIWAKILAVDPVGVLFLEHNTKAVLQSFQAELVRDGGHKYFLNILADPFMPQEHRAMAAFVMACIVRNYPAGQEAALQGSLIATCLEQLNDPLPLLRQWLALCLGLTWENYDKARWCGVRDTAHEKLYSLLEDDVPEIRAAAVFALGTFLNSAAERTDQANSIDQGVGMRLKDMTGDGSTLVRKELVVALQWLVLTFESQFIALVWQEEQEKGSPRTDPMGISVGTPPSLCISARKNSARLLKQQLNSPHLTNNNNQAHVFTQSGDSHLSPPLAIRRVASSSSLATNSFSGIGSIYVNIWKAVLTLAADPYPEVANMAQQIVNEVKRNLPQSDNYMGRSDPSISEPSSPSNNNFTLNNSPHQRDSDGDGQSSRPHSVASSAGAPAPCLYTPYSRKRTLFGREPSITEEATADDQTNHSVRAPLISTSFIDWCAKHFCDSANMSRFRGGDADTESELHQQREWRIIRNLGIKTAAKEELKRVDPSRLDERIFQQRNAHLPSRMALHPYEPHLFVAERESFSVWLWENPSELGYSSAPALLGTHSNVNSPGARISSLQLINPHDSSLLMLGSDDGAVKVWSGYSPDRPQPKLVTAFQIFADLQPNSKGPGLLLLWDQDSTQLAASGEPKVIRLWDSQREMRVQDISVGSDAAVTSLTSDGQHLICAGCRDGTIRVFDKRLQDARIFTFREHEHSIVHAHIFPDQEKHVSLLSGSSNGEVRFWDKRLLTSVKHMQVAQTMTSMAVHGDADVFACGVSNAAGPSINVYTLDGFSGSVVSHYDGFIGQRIAQVNCLAFHPLKVALAAGSIDNFVSIFGSRPC